MTLTAREREERDSNSVASDRESEGADRLHRDSLNGARVVARGFFLAVPA